MFSQNKIFENLFVLEMANNHWEILSCHQSDLDFKNIHHIPGELCE